MPEPEIDYAALVFPSDTLLTFKTLRGLYPALFDTVDADVTFFQLPQSHGTNPQFHIQNLTNLLEGEREVARFAFSRALGRSWQQRHGCTEGEVKRYLTDDYIRYGIARGKQHAAQLIRTIEKLATSQARGHGRS